MLSFPRVVSAGPISFSRLATRLSGCLMLTGFNLYVIITCAPVLFRAAIHHPVALIVVTALFVSLLGTLCHIWARTLVRSRLP